MYLKKNIYDETNAQKHCLGTNEIDAKIEALISETLVNAWKTMLPNL